MVEKVTRETTVGEVLERWPGSAEILADYGLHCIGCAFNPFDSIENGCRLHGMSEEKIDELVAELNSFAKKSHDEWEGRAAVELTPAALEKIKEILSSEKKQGHGLRVTASINEFGMVEYGLELEEKPKEKDVVLEQDGLKIFFSPEVERFVKGTVVDYLRLENDEGFKVEKRSRALNGCCGS